MKKVRRIKNVALAFIAILYSTLNKRSLSVKENSVEHLVCIYLTNNIGDMVCITPLLDSIKEHNQKIKITIIGSKINEGILANHPSVDVYYVHKSFRKTVFFLRSSICDAGVSITMDTYNLAILMLSNIKQISCFYLTDTYSKYMARPFRILASIYPVNRIPYVPGSYIPEAILRLVEPFDIITNSKPKTLAFSENAKIAVSVLLASYGVKDNESIVSIAPGAGSELKRWSAEKFAEIARYLNCVCRCPVVILGGPNDLKSVKACIKYMHQDVQYIDFGPLTMDNLKAVIARSEMLIGNDSGAVHIAEGVNTSAIAIVGSTDDAEHFRLSKDLRVIRGSVETHDLYRAYIGDEQAMDADVAMRRMESVSVDMVIKEVNYFLHERKKVSLTQY